MDNRLLILEGQTLPLEPLSMAHHAQLCEIALEKDLWHWTPVRVLRPGDMRTYIQWALYAQTAGVALPFATIDRSSGRAIGSTHFANIDRASRRAEIGGTWLGLRRQRNAANTEAKYLMFRHTFETWNLT